MSRFWSSFAAAAVGATLWAGSAAAGGYGAPSAPCGPAPAPCGGFAAPATTFLPPPPAVGPNCGPGYAQPFGYQGGFHGYRPAPPPPICTTEIQWQTTYRTEQRCHETWREVSIPVSRAASVPGTCGPNQVCQQDVFRIKVPHCEPRTVTVPVSNPVRVTTCRQPDVNSCGVVGQPLEDRRWSDRWDRNDRWDRWDGRDGRWDGKGHGGFGRDDWRRPAPPIHNPGPSFHTGSVFGPSYGGPVTNYRAARTSLSVDLGDAAPASATVVASAPAVEVAPAAPVASGSTQWLPY
ncbi:hypothetical protein [Neomegalonema sp.]|uniref:hypothetical protein n=1 Tax=Neomegalonema sp. TaxID=2039713 RepID=UPI0026239296|nr:hypothetical protein [Neomegalonema sp.]MDD2867554.1 hypothetical protein [Neomegalonema sp.]